MTGPPYPCGYSWSRLSILRRAARSQGWRLVERRGGYALLGPGTVAVRHSSALATTLRHWGRSLVDVAEAGVTRTYLKRDLRPVTAAELRTRRLEPLCVWTLDDIAAQLRTGARPCLTRP